jgi:hypothetical protein
MLGNLESSVKISFNPQMVCNAFKDNSGKPIDVRIQQDANEYFNKFIDKVEMMLKGGPYHNLFSPMYGMCSNQIIYQDKMREQLSSFTSINLEVKDMENMYASLDKYVMPNTISDFQWDDTNRVEIQKLMCLGNLPNTMVFLNQRYVS